MLKIKDENGSVMTGLFRNENGAIVADEDEAYNRYMTEKRRLDEINNLTSDVQTLKTEMTSIKDMLIEILNKVNQ